MSTGVKKVKAKILLSFINLKVIAAILILVGLPLSVFLATHQQVFQQEASQKSMLTSNGVWITPSSSFFIKAAEMGKGIYQLGGINSNATVIYAKPLVDFWSKGHAHISSSDITNIAPLPKVQDQGTLGSCVAWTTDYYMRGWYAIRDGHYPQGKKEGFSPMYTISQIEAPYGKFVGSSIDDNLYILKTQGVDTRQHYSHADIDWQDIPNKSERANAANYKISGYKLLFSGNPPTNLKQQYNRIEVLEEAISSGNPVAITIIVNNEFMHPNTDYHSAIPVIDDAGNPVTVGIHDPGAHIVTLFGYRDTHHNNGSFSKDSGFFMVNSWGGGWGYNGKAILSMNFIKNRVLNAYVITGVEPPLPTCQIGSFCSPTDFCTKENDVTRASGTCFKVGQVCCKQLPPSSNQQSCIKNGGVCIFPSSCRQNCNLSNAKACTKMDCGTNRVCCFQ